MNAADFIPRQITPALQAAATEVPVVTLTGPRQSGKTTLVRAAFPGHAYFTLEDPEFRAEAVGDPRGFLARATGPVIIDEAQRAPDLFSYLQVEVDERPRPGRFVLTGSQNFLLLSAIGQSLAGRTAILHLLPLSWSEMLRRTAPAPGSLGGAPDPARDVADADPFAELLRGFYPRVRTGVANAQAWLRDYYQTWIERDVRQVTNVGDLEAFDLFVRMCAGRCGQLLNLSSLAADCGLSQPTARRWLSVLEASFVILRLRPYHRNYRKRLSRSPRLYFTDTGLLCALLRIRTADDLRQHPLRGAVFESHVVAELHKAFLNARREPALHFWRDSAGREVDVVIDDGPRPLPMEIKSGQTVATDFFRGLEFWRELTGEADAPAVLVYGGSRSRLVGGTAVLSWSAL